MKLTEFENPLSGEKGNIFDLSKLWSLILGVFVFMFVVATGQRVASIVSGKLPFVDTTIDPLTRQNVAMAPSREIFD